VPFTDSHCHLDDAAFSEKLPSLLARCLQHSIHRIIVPSIAPSNFESVLALCKAHHNNPIRLHPGLGIHPWFLETLTEVHLERLEAKIVQQRDNIIAIGEIGLDSAIVKKAADPAKNLAQQQYFFDFQLNLAKEQQLPVIVHHRQSHDKIIPFLKKYHLESSGVIHGFSGSYQQACAYLDLGFKLGIGSTITYSRAKKTIDTVKRLPLTSLLIETDAPGMPLSKEVLTDTNKQQLNSPLHLNKIFEILVSIRTESANEIAAQVECNVERLFF